MKITNTLEQILSVIRQRTDFKSAEYARCSEGCYIVATLQENPGPLHQIVIHPILESEGPCLRVCHLNAARIPPFIEGERLCALLNDANSKGHFALNGSSKENIFFVLNHILTSKRLPEAQIINRLICTAIKSSRECRLVIQKTTKMAQEMAVGRKQLQAINPALN